MEGTLNLSDLVAIFLLFYCAPLKIKYHIYVYLTFKFIISEVVSFKIFGPAPNPHRVTRGWV